MDTAHACTRLRRRRPARSVVLAVGLAVAGCNGSTATTASSTATSASTTAAVQATHDSYPDHAEPALAINPRNPHKLFGVALYFGQSPRPGTFSSKDGGSSWHDGGPLPLPPGASGADNASAGYDAHGTAFVVAGSMTADPSGRGV